MTDTHIHSHDGVDCDHDHESELSDGLQPSTSGDQIIWTVLNNASMPLWAAMIFAPDSKITRRLMDRSGYWFAGLSAAYVVQLVATVATSGPPTGFSLDGLRKNMSTPAGFFTGWTHFLAFDLFVGRWIWQRAQAEGRSARAALVLTLMVGPAGLGLFGIQRGSLTLDHRPA